MRRILASRKTPFAAKIYRGTQKEKSDSSKKYFELPTHYKIHDFCANCNT